jgi:hypothetical protein
MRAKLKVLARVGLGGIALGLPLSLQAFDFDVGGAKASFDTTLSAGAIWRMQKQDDDLISAANGGKSRSINDDDGNLNYKKGDVVSSIVKATNDFEIKYGDFGLFNRVSAFYDFQAHDDDEYFGDRGDDRLKSEIDFLDAFVYANFKLNGRNSSVRLGKQVVNWGESTFITNSINTINPIDVSRLRAPGSELKEALLPIPMFWGSTSLTDSLSLEAVWLWSFQETQIDPAGSYFSTNDFLSDDGRAAYAGSGRRNDQHNTEPLSVGTAAVPIARVSDDRPQNETQQYGVALRYFADWLNSTEIGLYYLKYHSRVPLFSGLRATDTSSTPARAASARYFAEYPEDIELYGLSFNTDGPLGIALQGEYSYRPNLPIQLAGVEALLAALRLPNTIDAEVGPTYFATAPTLASGYRRVHAHQAQMTGTKAFGPTLGAQQFTLLGEVGVTKLELDKDLLYSGPGTVTLPSCRNPASIITAVGNGSCQDARGFADGTSWGYRLVSRMDYENLIGAVQVSPRVVFAHDVNGVGPAFNEDTKAMTFGVGFNYLQRWQADIGYTAFFGGRTYSGTDPFPPGAVLPTTPPTPLAGSANQSADFSTSANPLKDRDFLAISVSYAF